MPNDILLANSVVCVNLSYPSANCYDVFFSFIKQLVTFNESSTKLLQHNSELNTQSRKHFLLQFSDTIITHERPIKLKPMVSVGEFSFTFYELLLTKTSMAALRTAVAEISHNLGEQRAEVVMLYAIVAN